MDKLEKGTWVVNSVKHLLNIKSSTPELDYYEATEQAGKAGIFLSRLVSSQQEVISYTKAKVFARQSGISPAETKVYLDYLKEQGQIDFTCDSQNKVKELEIYCFSGQDAIKTVANLYDKFESSEEEQGSLLALQATYQLPRYSKELGEILIKSGINEESAFNVISMQKVLGLAKVSGQESNEIIYNEYAFDNDPVKIKKALEGLKQKEKDMVYEVQQIVLNSQGFLADNLPSNIKPEIVYMMEGVGLLDGITVKSPISEATFFTTPQIKGLGVGTFPLSTDVFHKAKILLSCLRFGQMKSFAHRGKISSNEKLLNIVNKLNRLEWVGKCTAIGQDYQLLETDGVIETQDAGQGMFYMRLRQPEVGLLVKQMLDHNKLIIDVEANVNDVFSQKATQYIIPELRKKQIEAKSTEPVIAMREKMLQSLRTGGL